MCRLAFIIILSKKTVAVIPRSKWRFSWKHHLYTRDFSLPRLIIGGEFFWKCATFNQSCQWVRIGPILAALGHMVGSNKGAYPADIVGFWLGSKHPTQFSSSRTTRAVMQGKGHATMGFATIKWTTCNPKWPNNGIFSNVQLA